MIVCLRTRHSSGKKYRDFRFEFNGRRCNNILRQWPTKSAIILDIHILLRDRSNVPIIVDIDLCRFSRTIQICRRRRRRRPLARCIFILIISAPSTWRVTI